MTSLKDATIEELEKELEERRKPLVIRTAYDRELKLQRASSNNTSFHIRLHETGFGRSVEAALTKDELLQIKNWIIANA